MRIFKNCEVDLTTNHGGITMKDSYANNLVNQLYRSLKAVNLDSFESRVSPFQQFITIGPGVPSEEKENTTRFNFTFGDNGKDPNYVEYAKIFDAIMELPVEDVLDCITKVSWYGAINQAMLNKFKEDIFSNLKHDASNSNIRVLITDFERYGSKLMYFINSLNNVCDNNNVKFEFTLASGNPLVCDISEIAFRNYKNINIKFLDIRKFKKSFDAVLISDYYVRGGRWWSSDKDRKIFDPANVYTLFLRLIKQNSNPKLFSVIVPMGFFCSNKRGIIDSRWECSKSGCLCEASILPDKIFSKWTSLSLRLALLSLNSFGCADKSVSVKEYTLKDDKLVAENETQKRLEDFILSAEKPTGWNLSLILMKDDKNAVKFLDATERICDVAEVIRGRQILKEDIVNSSDPNAIKVINISSMTGEGIDTSKCDTLASQSDDEAKFFLKKGDLLIATKGTVVKTDVFEEEEGKYITSSNITTVRPNPNLLGWYLKIFFESPIGKKTLNSLKRGTIVSNINTKDVLELEVPLPDLQKQKELIQKYKDGLKRYKDSIVDATNTWEDLRNEIFNNLYEQESKR